MNTILIVACFASQSIRDKMNAHGKDYMLDTVIRRAHRHLMEAHNIVLPPVPYRGALTAIQRRAVYMLKQGISNDPARKK